MGALPRPAVSAGPHRELVEALHDLHHRAGLPSLRRIAAGAGCSHTTVSHILSSPRVPTWDHLSAVVEALGGDEEEFHRRWLALTAPTPGPVPDIPLVGRHEELAVGHGFFRDAGRLLFLQGEAGSGKTRLLETLTTGTDRCALGARCVPLSRGEPLMPLAALLRAALRVDDGEWVSDALEQLPEFVAPSLAPLLPELASPDPQGGAEAEFARHRLFTAACLLLAELDRRRPCVVALDDLHWADDSTRDFLSFAVTYDQGPPIVCAWRVGDPEIGHTAEDWRTHTLGLPGVTTLTIGPLTEQDSLTQLRWLGIEDPTTARALHQRSGGLPLFTEHLARSADPGQLPERLADLLTQRLRILPLEGRRVADTLALLDRPAAADHLPELTGLTGEDLSTGLRHLADRHLLRQTTDTVALGHPLLAQAARDTLLPTERLDHHRRLATALENHPDAAPSEIAHHWRAAGDTDRGLPWEVRAALLAEHRWAFAEAASHWQRAINTWPVTLHTLEDPPLGRTTALRHALEAHFELDAPDAVTIAEAAVADVVGLSGPDVAAILAMAAWILMANDHTQSGLELLDRAAEMVQELPPSTTQVEVLEAQEFLLGWVGRVAEARAVAHRALQVCSAIGDTRRRLVIHADLAMYALTVGDLPGMRKHLEASAPGPHVLDLEPLRLTRVAVQRTSALMDSGAGPDEVSAAATGALAAIETLGIETFLAEYLRATVCQSFRMAARIPEATSLVHHAAAERPQRRNAASHLEVAALDLIAGRTTEAVNRAQALLELTMRISHGKSSKVVVIAEAELWAGRARDARAHIIDLLTTEPAPSWEEHASELLVLAARASADLVKTGQFPPSNALDVLADILGHADPDPFLPLETIPSHRAHHAQWLGELGRIDGKPDVEAWSTAIRRWDALGRPFDAAYCRWRAAQACIELGQATAAARLLRRGLKDAREHVPLREALSATLNEVAQARADSGGPDRSGRA